MVRQEGLFVLTGTVGTRVWGWGVLVALGMSCVGACHSRDVRSAGGPRPPLSRAGTERQARPRPDSGCALAGPHALSRDLFERYVKAGPGHLLAQVEIRRYPKRGEGPFRGWRVLEVRDPCLALAVRPGDVILAVDGRVVERPTDLWELWRSLKTASHLTILRLRNGHIRRLELDIVD